MIYKFRVISDENELFLRVIEISAQDTFYSLHTILSSACNFKYPQMTSFYTSNEDWEKLQEFTLMDMMDESTQTIAMQQATLVDYITQKNDTLIYVFDFFGDRALFLTLTDIKHADKAVQYPLCSHSVGNAPLLSTEEEQVGADIFNEFEDEYDNDFDDSDFDEFDNFESFNEDFIDSDY